MLSVADEAAGRELHLYGTNDAARRDDGRIAAAAEARGDARGMPRL